MNLSEQVVSIELAKKLKELNVTQESLFRWQNVCDSWEPTALKKEYIEKNNHNPENYSAFTVAELGEMLHTLIQNDSPEKSDVYLQYFKSDKWVCCFITMPFQLTRITEAETEADARAKMLIYLLENKLIEV